MENASIGISPNEELDSIMKDIEKYQKEEELNSQDSDNNGYVDPRVDVEGEVEAEEPSTEVSTGDEIPESPTKELTEESVDKSEQPIDELELFKEKYQLEKKKRKNLYADRQSLEDENAELKQIIDNAVNTNRELQDRDLKNGLEKIKNIKKQALLGEDADLYLEADELYQKMLYEVNKFENSQSNVAPSSNVDHDNSHNNDRTNEDVEREQEMLMRERERRSKRWLYDKPELIEGSDKFNPVIQKEMSSFISKLDTELIKHGRSGEILNDEYLDVLEDYLDNIKVTSNKEGYTASKVGGVKNSFSGGNSKSPTKVVLSKFEKNYAKNLGISEKEFLKYKIEDIKSKKKGK